MQRDYSKRAEERLKNIADMCKEEGAFNVAKDFCEDLLTNFALSTGLLKAEGALFNFDGDFESYRACVIDAKNMKESEIERIFQDCRNEDKEYSEHFIYIQQRLSGITATLQAMSDAITPLQDILSVKKMDLLADRIENEVSAYRSETTAYLNHELSLTEARIAEDAVKDVAKGTVGFVGDIFSFCYGVVTGRPDKALSALYDTVDGFVGTLWDSGALLAVGMSATIGVFSSKTDGDALADARLEILGSAEEMHDRDGMSDTFHDFAEEAGNGTGMGDAISGMWETLGGACDVVEDIKVIYDTADLFIGTADEDFLEFLNPVDLPKGVDSVKTAEEIAKIKKELEVTDDVRKIAELEKKKKSLEMLLKLDRSWIDEAGAAGKTIGGIIGIYEDISEGNPFGYVMGGTNTGKLLSSANDLDNMVIFGRKKKAPSGGGGDRF